MARNFAIKTFAFLKVPCFKKNGRSTLVISFLILIQLILCSFLDRLRAEEEKVVLKIEKIYFSDPSHLLRQQILAAGYNTDFVKLLLRLEETKSERLVFSLGEFKKPIPEKFIEELTKDIRFSLMVLHSIIKETKKINEIEKFDGFFSHCIDILGEIGNKDTIDLLVELSPKWPCHRAKKSAKNAIEKIKSRNKEIIKD